MCAHPGEDEVQHHNEQDREQHHGRGEAGAEATAAGRLWLLLDGDAHGLQKKNHAGRMFNGWNPLSTSEKMRLRYGCTAGEN